MKGLHLVLRLSVPRGWCDQVAPQLRTALEQAPFWGALRLLEMDEESKPKKLTPGAFTKALKDEDSRGWKLFSDAGEELAQVAFGFEKSGLSAVLRIRLQGQAWLELSRATVDWLPSCLAILGHPKVIPNSGVSLRNASAISDPELPRFPTAPFVAPENVIDVVDARIIGASPNWEGDPVVARMLSSPADGFRREVSEGYTFLFFTDDLTNESALLEARKQHRRWLARMVAPD